MGRDKDDSWSPSWNKKEERTLQEWLEAELQEARNPPGSPGSKGGKSRRPGIHPVALAAKEAKAKEPWRTPATCSMQRGRVASASVESLLDCKTQTNVNLRLKRMSSRSRVRVVEGWGLEASSTCYMSSQLSFSNFKGPLNTV